MPSWLVPVLDFVGGIGNGLLNWFTGKTNTDKTIEAQKEMADYQFAQNKEMWQLQNEYNSPISQLQRLKDAGLNTNLIYGNLSSSNASSAPSFEAPNLQYNYRAPQFDFNSALAAYNQVRLTDAETSLKREQAAKEQALASYYMQETLNKSLDYDVADYDFNEKKDLRAYRYLIANNNWKMSDVDVRLKLLEEEHKKKVLDYIQNQTDYLGEQIEYLGRRNEYQEKYHITEDMNWYDFSKMLLLSLIDFIPNPNKLLKMLQNVKNWENRPRVGFR